MGRAAISSNVYDRGAACDDAPRAAALAVASRPRRGRRGAGATHPGVNPATVSTSGVSTATASSFATSAHASATRHPPADPPADKPLAPWVACAAAELARRADRLRPAQRLIRAARAGADDALVALRCADVALGLGAWALARRRLRAAIRGAAQPAAATGEILTRLEVALGGAEARAAQGPKLPARPPHAVAVDPVAAPPRALPTPPGAPPVEPEVLRWLVALGEVPDPVAEARWHAEHLQAAALLLMRGEIHAAQLWLAAAQIDLERRSVPPAATEARRAACLRLLDATETACRAPVGRAARLHVIDLLARLHTRALADLRCADSPELATEITRRLARLQAAAWQAVEAAVALEGTPETWCWLGRAAAQRDRAADAARALRTAERLMPPVPSGHQAVTLGLSWAALAPEPSGLGAHLDRAVAWLRTGLPSEAPHWTRVRGALVFALLTGQPKAAAALTQGQYLVRLPPALWPTLSLALVAVGAARHAQAVLARAFVAAEGPAEAWHIAAAVESCPPLRIVCADHHGPESTPDLDRWPFDDHAGWVRTCARAGRPIPAARSALWRRVEHPEQALWALADRVVTPSVAPDTAPLWARLEWAALRTRTPRSGPNTAAGRAARAHAASA